MAVTALTAFPAYFNAGDTVRLSLANTDYPSSAWTLDVVLRGASSKTFRATADGTGYAVVIPAADSAKLTPGSYNVTLVYTHTDGERDSEPYGRVEVLPNPTAAPAKTIARQTLDAMEAALLKLAGGSNASVSFNGQSFTKKNLDQLQNAIERQKGIVRLEEQRASGRARYGGIGVRFGRPYAQCCD